MTAVQERPVTPETFAGAKTYDEYRASIASNTAKFDDNLAKTSVPADLAKRYQALVARPDGPKKLLVIGEDWCPDVYRGIPVAKKIADAAGMDLKILERDQHMDVMNHFLNGEFASIPVFVFLTEKYDVIATFIERPKLANEQMREALSPVFGPSGTRQLTEALGRAPTPEEKAEAEAAARQRYDEFQASSPFWAGWRDATISEVLDLLEQKLGMAS